MDGAYKKYAIAEGGTVSPSSGFVKFPLPDGFLSSYQYTGEGLVFWDGQKGAWYDCHEQQWEVGKRADEWERVTDVG